MSNSNIPVKFIDILKKEIPPNMLNTVINNLQNEIVSNPKLAKSIKKIEETFNEKGKKIEKFTEENNSNDTKPKPNPKPILKKKQAPEV
jgi:arsenate reductase-like glutaredoxin family protein